MPLLPSLRIALLALAFIGAGTVAAQTASLPVEPPAQALSSLLSVIKERLEIADLVALTKWDSAKPIQDSLRETAVIAGAQHQAEIYGIDKNDAAQLLSAQIEANKLVQYGLLAAWQIEGAAPRTKRPDLNIHIRPQLDELQTRLLEQYAKFSVYRANPQCPEWLNELRTQMATDQLHYLALVRATGELCTGVKPHA